jgi:NAD(P)H-hydrate epimerase
MKSTTHLISSVDARNGLRIRVGNEHKNSVGRVLVIAGSKGMTGAAVLAASSALRSGSGIVTLLSPESLNNIYEVKLTEVMTYPLPDGDKGFFDSRNIQDALELCEKYEVIAIGPGLGRQPETIEFIRGLLTGICKRAVVLDADGLFPFTGKINELASLKMPLIITPHEGELCRITADNSVPSKADERIAFLSKTARKLKNCTIVLKGGPTLVSTSSEEVYINATGNAGMATAGSGDVLTGIIAGLLSQNKDVKKAVLSGVYLHGLAGDKAKEKLTEYALTAGSIIEYLPEAFKEIEHKKR